MARGTVCGKVVLRAGPAAKSPRTCGVSDHRGPRLSASKGRRAVPCNTFMARAGWLRAVHGYFVNTVIVMKEIVEKIDKMLNDQNFITLACARYKIPTSSSGFYWIYTKLPLSSFANSEPPRPGTKHVDFSKMAELHGNLESIIRQSNQNYWCIYNGKGKELKKRLSAEFTSSGDGTGKLALTRCFGEDNFRVKYIICKCNDSNYGVVEHYTCLEKDIERVWRLHYGWPFLCRT